MNKSNEKKGKNLNSSSLLFYSITLYQLLLCSTISFFLLFFSFPFHSVLNNYFIFYSLLFIFIFFFLFVPILFFSNLFYSIIVLLLLRFLPAVTGGGCSSTTSVTSSSLTSRILSTSIQLGERGMGDKRVSREKVTIKIKQ